MVVGPSNNPLRKFPFVDREECKQTFQDFLKNLGQKNYNILHFYGISGIGKSKLQQELQSILEKEHQDIIWGNIDFKVKTHREIGTFLFSLRSQLSGKYKVNFDHFDIAHAVYWKKINPEIALAKEKYGLVEAGSALDIILQVLNLFGPFSLAVNISNYMLKAPKKFENWIKKERGFIDRLNESNLNELEQLLPVFFIDDLRAYLEAKSKKAVIFIDTYEALWEEARDTGNFNSKDDWIRNIIANFESVSWVACGREELRWSEVDTDWNNYLDQHKVGVLSKEYCIEFLESSGVNEKDIQDIIIEASEGYPYYLALSLDTYFAIKGRTPVPEDFPKTRPEIFNCFFHYLNAAERSTLKKLSCANFWDHDLMNLLIDKFGTNYPKSKEAFEELHRFSFMVNRQNGTWDMHPLMKKSLQENLDPEEKAEVHEYLFNHFDEQLEDIDLKNIQDFHKTALDEAFYHGKQIAESEDLFLWFSKRSDIFDKAGFWDFLIPLYSNIHNILEKTLGSEHLKVATSLNNLAATYCSMGMYEKALPIYEKAIEILEKTLGPEHPDVATSLNNLAELYRLIGKYEEALSRNQRALEIQEKTPGSEHLKVATSLNNLAATYYSMGMYEKALPIYEKAIEVLEKTLGPEHPDVATSLNNLAATYYSMGMYEKALPIYEKAIEILEKTLGPEHPDVATSLNNLAGLYRLIGKYEEALSRNQRALEIQEKRLGEEHPNVAISLNNLAELYYSMGVYEKALPKYEKAIEILEKKLGPEHPNVATSLDNLAKLYHSMEKYEKALPIYERVIKIFETTLGPEHPDVATSLDNLAKLYHSMEKYEKALYLYQRALGIREKSLGEKHPDVATSLNNLATFYYSTGRYEEALPLYECALTISEKTLGPEHPNVATSLHNLAVLYESMEKYEEALPLYKRALKIREITLGKEHIDAVTSLNNLAFLYYLMENYEEALPLYKHVLAIYEKSLGEEHPDVVRCLNYLALLYILMEKYEEALPIYKRVLAITEKTLGEEHSDYIAVKESLALLLIKLGNNPSP